MAIKKSELVSLFTKQQKCEIAAFESRTDEMLRSKYAGKQVNFEIPRWPCDKVRREIERRYKEAGWKIKFGSDQRDGNWVELS